jgi:hypothetical protein
VLGRRLVGDVVVINDVGHLATVINVLVLVERGLSFNPTPCVIIELFRRQACVLILRASQPHVTTNTALVDNHVCGCCNISKACMHKMRRHI